MSTDTSSPAILMLRTARVATKSLPVFGSTRLLSVDWTCASLRDMKGRGKRLSVPKSPLEFVFSRLYALTHAIRDDGAAVRQRAVPHRPHHGVHPGRHLGALPAHAGQCRALHGRGRRAWRADHARRAESR